MDGAQPDPATVDTMTSASRSSTPQPVYRYQLDEAPQPTVVTVTTPPTQPAALSDATSSPPPPPGKPVDQGPVFLPPSVTTVLQLWSNLAAISPEHREKVLLSLSQTGQLSQAQSALVAFHATVADAPYTAALQLTFSPRSQLPKTDQDASPSLSSLSAAAVWVVTSWFPAWSAPSVNYCKLNTPWAVAKRLYYTPAAISAAQPTSWWNAFFTFLGVFASLTCVGVLHQYYTQPNFDWPILYASLGALATLMFCSPGYPPVQPYHTFVGTLIATFFAVTVERGIGTTDWLWLSVAVSGAVSITVMQLLGATHPPGGALALLYILTPSVQVLGYWYILAGEVGAFIMFLVALLVNNAPQLEQRRYPRTWVG